MSSVGNFIHHTINAHLAIKNCSSTNRKWIHPFSPINNVQYPHAHPLFKINRHNCFPLIAHPSRLPIKTSRQPTTTTLIKANKKKHMSRRGAPKNPVQSSSSSPYNGTYTLSLSSLPKNIANKRHVPETRTWWKFRVVVRFNHDGRGEPYRYSD